MSGDIFLTSSIIDEIKYERAPFVLLLPPMVFSAMRKYMNLQYILENKIKLDSPYYTYTLPTHYVSNRSLTKKQEGTVSLYSIIRRYSTETTSVYSVPSFAELDAYINYIEKDLDEKYRNIGHYFGVLVMCNSYSIRNLNRTAHIFANYEPPNIPLCLATLLHYRANKNSILFKNLLKRGFLLKILVGLNGVVEYKYKGYSVYLHPAEYLIFREIADILRIESGLLADKKSKVKKMVKIAKEIFAKIVEPEERTATWSIPEIKPRIAINTFLLDGVLYSIKRELISDRTTTSRALGIGRIINRSILFSVEFTSMLANMLMPYNKLLARLIEKIGMFRTVESLVKPRDKALLEDRLL